MRFDVRYTVVALVLLSGILYYHVTLGSPVVFGDEGYYASIGRWIFENAIYPKYEPYHSTDIYHQPLAKRPLYFYFNSAAWLLGDFGIHLMIPIFSLLSALLLFASLNRFGAPKAGAFAAFTLLMLPGLVTYGVMNYVETLLILLFVSAIHFYYLAVKQSKMLYFILAGIFTGFAALTDATGLFLFPIFGLHAIVSKRIFRLEFLKSLLILGLVAILLITPQIARNVITYGNICYSPISRCEPIKDVEIPVYTKMKFPGAPQVGTNLPILKLGLLSYFRFALGWTGLVLFLLSLPFLIRKREFNYILLAWLAGFVFVMFKFSGVRAEDMPRYTLFAFPVIALACGIFVNELYEKIKSYNKIFALGLTCLLLFGVWIYGQEKLDTMIIVKHNLDGLVNACEWVKMNTPKDSLLWATYGHQVAYQCDRRTIATVPDRLDILYFANDTSYERLKAHGFDYVIVEAFTVIPHQSYETTPVKFVEYLESSEHFQKVYDNRGNYGNGGLIVYKIL